MSVYLVVIVIILLLLELIAKIPGDDWFSTSLGAGDTTIQRHSLMERQLAQKHQEIIPDYEMEKILAKRKNPKEREKVLSFYDTLLQVVADELNGKSPEYNETVEGLLEQLIEDLKAKGQYGCCYENLEPYEKRMELLMMLYDRIKIRRDKVAKREEILDDIEQKVMPQLFEVTAVEPDEEYQLPAAMWQQAIEKMPNKRHMESLKMMYPIPVVEQFIILLAAFKEEIAERMHRRHERIATQMKKELKKEGSKKKKEAEKMESFCLDTEVVYKAVTAHFKKKQSVEEQNRNQFKLPMSDHTKLYEDLRAAALDAQKLVEEEAARGKFLAEQINTVAEQNEIVKEIHDDAVRKCEIANAKILRNIQRLNHAIKQYENRISNIRNLGDNTKENVQKIITGIKRK